MERKKLLGGYLLVIASAFLFGCMPLMTKFIYAEGVNSLSLVLLRNTLSLPMLAVLAWKQNKSMAIPLKSLIPLSLIAVMGCCLTPFLLFSAYRHIASGAATVLHFVYPAIVLVAGILFLRKKARVTDILCVVVCVAGMLLFYDPAQQLNWQGCALALVSGLTYAIYVVLLAVFRYKEISGFKLAFYVSLICVVLMVVPVAATGNLVLPTSLKGWLLCVLLALTISVGAVVLFQQGTFRIGGERASILSAVEPITGMVVGILVFSETVSVRSVCGSALVILAGVLIAVFDLRNKK